MTCDDDDRPGSKWQQEFDVKHTSMCWSNAMCLTGLCANNMGGLKRGLCAMGRSWAEDG